MLRVVCTARVFNAVGNLECLVGGVTMWTVVYMASDKKTAEKVKEILEGECILVKIRAGQEHTLTGEYYEVMVPEGEIDEARDCIYLRGL